MSVSQEEADLAKRIVELEKELIKAKLDVSGQKGLVAKFERDAKHWARRLYKAETQASDWKRVAGDLAALLKDCPAQFASADEAFEGLIVQALAAFEAMEKAPK